MERKHWLSLIRINGSLAGAVITGSTVDLDGEVDELFCLEE